MNYDHTPGYFLRKVKERRRGSGGGEAVTAPARCGEGGRGEGGGGEGEKAEGAGVVQLSESSTTKQSELKSSKRLEGSANSVKSTKSTVESVLSGASESTGARERHLETRRKSSDNSNYYRKEAEIDYFQCQFFNFNNISSKFL